MRYGVTACVALGLVGAACGILSGSSDDPPAPSNPEAGPAVDGGVEDCGAPAYDREGCLCPTPSTYLECHHAAPVPGSVCDLPGAQSCGPGADGQNRWGACTGGGTRDAAVCHEGPCGEGVDLCRPDQNRAAPPFDPDKYTAFAIPVRPKANQPFDLYVVTKNKPLVGPGVEKNPGGMCYGGGLSRPCASVGLGCEGWKVAAFPGLKESAATYTFRFIDPNDGPNGACGAGATPRPIIANLDVTVDP